MRAEFYRQCELRRPKNDGEEVMVSWIPEEKAKIGNIIKLRNSADEEWSENWRVANIYGRCQYADLEVKERDYLKQRKASDV